MKDEDRVWEFGGLISLPTTHSLRPPHCLHTSREFGHHSWFSDSVTVLGFAEFLSHHVGHSRPHRSRIRKLRNRAGQKTHDSVMTLSSAASTAHETHFRFLDLPAEIRSDERESSFYLLSSTLYLGNITARPGCTHAYHE